MRDAHQTGRNRGKTGLAVLTLAVLPATAAACSSASSGGLSPAEASASARASALGVTPIPNLGPGAHGPNGDITTPASNAPSKTSPGGSEVFPNVTRAQSKKFVKHLTGSAGVRTVAYYPQFDQMQVYYSTNATSADRERVYRYVVAHDPAAAGSPSATPSTSASPSATAS